MLYVLLSFIGGAFTTVQTAFNTRLGKDLRSPTFVSVESCLVGAVALTLYMLARREALPKLPLVTQTHPWLWMGGTFGAAFVLIMVLATPKLSVGAVTALAIAGQIILSVVFDHFAVLGLDRHPVSLGRIVAVVLFCIGAELLRRY